MAEYTEQDLITFGATVARAMLARSMGMSAFSGNRDYYQTLGYPDELGIDALVTRYKRGDIAGRIVDLPAQDTWKKAPRISEGEDDEDTEFVREWKALVERMHIWNVLMRADKLSGIGRYGVLLIGVRGDSPMSEPVEDGSLGNQKDILYLRPFSEENAAVGTWERDTRSERYNLPLTYSIKTSEGGAPLSVHYTRVLHLAEGKLDSETYGTPRLQRSYNRLDDLIKIVGGAAEAAWLNMRPGTLLTTQDGYTFPTDDDYKSAMDEQVYKYLHDISRILRIEGVDARQIGASEVPDIGSLFDACIGLIAAASGIPQRVLLGSAKGELSAAIEDMRQWAGEIDGRQQNYVEPEILRPFIARLQRFGALPETPDGYHVGTPDEHGEYHWPAIIQMTASEQAEYRDRMAGAVQKTVNPLTGDYPLTGGEVRVLLGYPAEPPEPVGAGVLVGNVLSPDKASHIPQEVMRACPLCGADSAYCYEGHGPLLVCAGCGKTYNPRVE